MFAMASRSFFLVWCSMFWETGLGVVKIPPFLVSGTRFFVAGVVLVASGRWRNREPLGWRNWGAATLMGAMFFLICHGGVSWAAQHVPSGISALLMASISMWTALLEWMRGGPSRPGKLAIASLLAGFAGVTALVIHPPTLAGSEQGALGAGVAVIGAFSWAAGTVLTRRMPLTTSTVVNSGMQMMTGGGLLLLLGATTGRIPDFAAITAPPGVAQLVPAFVRSLVRF